MTDALQRMAPRRAAHGRMAGMVLGLAGLACPAAAQTPTPSFAMVGHIEAFTLEPPQQATSGALMTVRGIQVRLPRNLLVTMPGRYMTAQDLFRGPQGNAAIQSGNGQRGTGLALADNPRPIVPFEAEVVGNIVDGQYIAGLVRITQGALHVGAGFIQRIDPASGEMRIGPPGRTDGARVRLNDPTGIYAAATGPTVAQDRWIDIRFALDPDNVPVHARTGFPVCVPDTTRAPELCPAGNRPGGAAQRRFTCARAEAAGPGGLQRPASPDAPSVRCDPERPVPLMVGDYVTYAGMLVWRGPGDAFIAAHGLDAELGIYTAPDSEPAYLFVEVALQGTLGEPFPGVPQEETTRFRIVGFSTDPSRAVEILLIDSDRPMPGRTLADGPWRGVSFTGPAGLPLPNGPQLGRFRNTWPAKDNARAVRRDVLVQIVGSPHGPTAMGLRSGRYTAPINEYITPEVTRFGVPGFAVSAPFENFCFLSQGGGRLNPFPNSGHDQPQTIGNGTVRVCDNDE